MAIGLVKPVIDLVVSIGVGSVVTNAIKATTPANLNIYGKIVTGVGSVVVGGAVAKLASTYVVEEVDGLVDTIKNIRKAPLIEEDDVEL